MSDTPRTDDAILDPEIVHQDAHSEGWVSIDFARQLERELKDARQIASKYDDRYFATRELLNVSTERAEKLERELAAANARIRRLEEALEFVVPFCPDLHHPKRYQHKAGDRCPVEEIIRKAKQTKP